MVEMTKIILVEDDLPTMERFERAIAQSPDLNLLAACPTFSSAKNALDEAKPDVLVTDLNLPDGHGLDLIRSVRSTWDDVEVMVISVLGDEKTVVSSIEAGASGYLLKDAEPIDIASAIQQLVGGGSPISASIARHILKKVRGPQVGKDDEDKPHLTERELEVLGLIAMGYTYRDIAKRAGMSENTVPTHIKSIYRKLEVSSRGEAVFEAVQRGLINLNEP